MDKIIKYVKPIGYTITVLSLIYIINITHNSDFNTLHFKNPFVSVLFILLFGVWASLFIVIGAYNWKLILEFVNGSSVQTKDVFQVYLKTNVAKYLPGNVMHYAGRNYLGSKLGWNNSEMAFSSLLEYIFGFGLTGIVILAFIGVGLVSIPPQVALTVNYNKILGLSALAAASAIVLVIFIYTYRYFVSKEPLKVTSRKLKNRAQQFFTWGFLVLSVKLFLISLLCFIMNCLYYYYLCDLVLNFHIKPSDFFNANVALSIANYMSILTPGVPGGLGVKESVSILLISAYGYPKESLVISILVYRITCVLGDIIPYFLVMLWKK